MADEETSDEGEDEAAGVEVEAEEEGVEAGAGVEVGLSPLDPAHENDKSTFPCSGLIVIVVDSGAPRWPATAPRRPRAFSPAPAPVCSK